MDRNSRPAMRMKEEIIQDMARLTILYMERNYRLIQAIGIAQAEIEVRNRLEPKTLDWAREHVQEIIEQKKSLEMMSRGEKSK